MRHSQECKVEIWLDSYISCYICFIKLNFSLIIRIDVLTCLSVKLSEAHPSRLH